MTWPGAYRAVVLSTTDPQNAGRVRLQVPQVSGTAPTWASPAQDAGRGPAVGDVVWVVYQGGDASYPLYIPAAPAPYSPPAWQVQNAPVVGGGLTLGNGAAVSRYQVDGHVVRWTLLITWGSTTTGSPTSAVTATVPVAQDPASGTRWVGSVLINPGGGQPFLPGAVWLFPGTTSAQLFPQRAADLAYVPFSVASLTVASGGWLTANLTYDRA